MPTALQFRRGTTTQNNSFTGALGEISVDTTLDVLRVHDGSTAGGFAMVSETATQTLTNKTLTSPVINTATFGTSILPTSANGTSLGSATKEFADLFLADGGTVTFGNDQDVILTHVADTGLTLSHVATADNKPIVFQLKSEEDAIIANEVIGSLEFAAGDSDGTDGATVAAGIHAIAEGTFSATANATKLVFTTGVSETAASSATAKMTLSSAGLLTLADDLMIKDNGTIGSASASTAMTIAATGIVTFADDILIKDGGTIGVTSDPNAIGISSGGVVSITATTASTSATSGALTVAGGAGVALDLSVGDDLRLISDAAVLSFGANSDVTLTHVADAGLTLSVPATADNSFPTFNLSAGDNDIAANDVLGQINFQAPAEGAGTDAILVAAGIAAISEGDFSASNNATKLSFQTGASEAAAEKMSLSSAGLLTVSGDVSIGDDLALASDGAVATFGANSEITLTHNHDKGLILKHTATADDKPIILTLATGEVDMAANDVMGKIEFQAPDEGTGTDAILVAAAIQARSEGDFSSSANATSLDFMTGASEAAATKMSLTSGGDVNVLTDGASIFFGASSEIELRHVADDGLILKHVGTGDGKEPSLTFQAGDADIAANDLLGSIQFQAPDEGAGTDAIVVSAAIAALSEGDFSASANATSLIFQTGASEVATTKMILNSGGSLDVSGDITGATLNADGDTAAGDNAAIGFTSAEGLILTGQGSTNDVTVKNDADADVISIPTGTTNVTLAGELLVTGQVTTGFGETVFDAPPFVPGFQENIGVYVLDNHTIFDEDRIANIGTNTFIWETDTDNSSALTAAVGTDLLTGGYTLATGGTDGHQTAIATAGTPFTCASGKPWWIKTRFNLNDHDGVEFFFGLTERAADVDSWHLTSAGAGTDRVGFVKAAHDNDAITFAAAKNAGGTISTALDTAQTYDADLSVVSLGIHWDGSNIKFYANKVATTATPGDMALVHTYNTAAGIPNDSALRLCLLVETGTGAVSTARIEYIKGAYTK